METVPRPSRLRRSLLDQFDKCAYAGYLYLKHEGGSPSHAANRGTIFHETVERVAKLALEMGDGVISGDVARDVAQQVIAERTDLPIPLGEQEAVRLMAWNWGEATELNPETVLLVERQVELEVGGYTVYGTIDLAEQADEGVLLVTDYKTYLALPTQEEYEQDFQAPFYAALVAHGRFADTGERVAERVREIRTRQVYPRFREPDGDLRQRERGFNQEQIADFLVALEAIIARLEEGLETGQWAAVPGDHCTFCPAPYECPIPKAQRPNGICSPHDAAEAAELWYRLDRERKELFYALREFARENGHIKFGNGLELGFRKSGDSMRFGVLK